MTKKTPKVVLIADDEPHMCQILVDRFNDCNKESDHPYEFKMEIALSAAECVQKVRAQSYDIIVLDIRMEDLDSGLQTSFGLYQQLGWETPVRIIFTGYPNYSQCVEAIRHGAWDYIVKEDVDNTSMTKIIVNSALTRLQELDLRREQEQQIASDWLPRNLWEIQAEHGGKLAALWHRPEVEVIASGVDAFELEVKLREWRKQHLAWEKPFIVRIPPQRGDSLEGH